MDNLTCTGLLVCVLKHASSKFASSHDAEIRKSVLGRTENYNNIGIKIEIQKYNNTIIIRRILSSQNTCVLSLRKVCENFAEQCLCAKISENFRFFGLSLLLGHYSLS